MTRHLTPEAAQDVAAMLTIVVLAGLFALAALCWITPEGASLWTGLAS